ncbi:hypothetical protein HWV62_36583 [Athelia sp. TMB]|nr:hypothetical protein HWV62_36583 [Athelia sp. TMB]
MLSPGIQGASTTAAASFLGNLNNRNVEKQAGEFNHAIQYLNKIKARYADDGDKYKTFLEILQTYQKEQRGLNDSQVYMHVQGLFKDAPDLLAEFKDFLPEISGMGMGMGPPTPQPPPESVPEKKIVPSAPPPKRRKKPVEKDPTPVPPPPKQAPNSRSKRAKHTHKGDDSPNYSPYQAPHSPPAAPAAAARDGPPRKMSTPDELLFFERAKKALEGRETYDEFLKLLNLFAKDIIDARSLVEAAAAFLGDGELHTQFKELMGWDERLHSVEYGPPGSIRTGPPETVQAPRVDEGQGLSYRRLPASEINLACSGRDELARSVLNDVWVSHPTWASEDSGFVSHKKTLHEDALHTCEQERHEFDTFIQANARTIAVLEPVWDRLQEMTADERAAFRLPPDLGGPTRSIYVRIIKRVYGSAHWEEVWDALQKAPAVAVAVVLDRLHQKDEEWRREQRTWSKIWRGLEAKNHYKALDHLGNNEWKNNEKKGLTAKHLVGDIEMRRKVQLRERTAWDAAHKGEPRRRWFAEGSVGPQLSYAFEDTEVLHDALKMVYSFLDHSQALYSQAERRAVETFLRQFVPLLFMYPEGEFNAACGPLEPTHAEDLATDTEVNGVKSGAASPAPTPSDDSRASAADDVWIREGSTQTPAQSPRTVPFFANSTYYTLLRMLQLLYSRLLMCKEIGARQMAAKYESLTPHPIAVELGLDDSNGPAAILAQAMDALGASGSRDTANVLYMYLLDAWEKVFASELDQSTLEEHMRWFFGTEARAYQVFTLDKVVTGIIKQVQQILADQKSLDLRTLLETARGAGESITNRDVIRYRREAELNVGSDEHLYRVEWDQSTKGMRIQLLGPEDASIEGQGDTGVDRWREYVDSYLLTHPTEWMPADTDEDRTNSAVYLRRCMTADETPQPAVRNDIGIQISLGTYKLFYEAGSEDILWRQRSAIEEGRVLERARRVHEERIQSAWLL